MRRFTHTFPQRISAFLLCLALLVGLLPVTALAAAPATLYVGETQITGSGYWTTDANGKLAAGTASNYNVYYDGNGTLTLNNATIQGRGNSNNTEPRDYGIYAAPTGGQSVSLTIKLIGSNTVSGYSGIYVGASGGDSTLVIQSDTNGSLEANGSGWNGITISSVSGNASLTINNASVVANSKKQSSHGVSIKSSSSTKLSLTVNGGSLTAKGTYGIFYSSLSGTIPSTFLTVSDSALIKAIPSIYASVASIPAPKADSESGGIVFDGNSGTVYGNVTLDESLTINQGETLTIPEGSSLDMGGNEITVASGGKLEGTPTGSGTVKIAPTITTTESLPDGEVGTVYSQTLTATGDPTITWSLASGTLPTGLSLSEDGKITGTPTTEGTSTFTVKAENSYGSDSREYTLTIAPKQTVSVTGVTLNKTTLELFTGGSATLTATVEPDNATKKNVTWTSSNTSVATVDANGNITAVGAGKATITVTTEDGSFTATCAVTVEKPYTPPPYIPPTYAVTVPDTTGGTVEVSPSRASSGRRVTITTQPAPGYELESLTVLDSRGSEIALTAQGDGKYTFTMPSRKVTVQASFAPVSLPFTDVAEDVWYEEAVRYAYTHGIMEGTSDTTFVPGKSLTRAEAVQVLYNLEGQPTVSESTTFPDLVYQWYKPAISWAESTGVVDGYEDGTFRPGQPVTREEFAQMLYDYAAYKGYDLTAEGDLSSFPDGDQVQKWALPAMTWANGNALINGHDDGTLEPGGTTIRAQAASILMRFDQNVVEN